MVDLELILGVLIFIALGLFALTHGERPNTGAKARAEKAALEAKQRWGGQHWRM